MAPESRGVESASFDLSPFAKELGRVSRFNRNFIRVGCGFFACLIPVGIYLLAFPRARTSPDYFVGPLILVVGCSIITIQGWWSMKIFGPAPRRLVVSSESVTFGESPGGPDRVLRWLNPKFGLEILDRTQLPL